MDSARELREFLNQFEIVTDEDIDIDFVLRRYCERKAIDRWLVETGRVYKMEDSTYAYLSKNIDVFGETVFTGESRTVKMDKEIFYDEDETL